MSENKFTFDQKVLIALLTAVQFTVVLDFVVLAPLGAQLMRELSINATQFSLVVSAYAISAGASGFLLAGVSDRFDRKKLLLWMYTGFIFGTFLCAIAHNFHFLMIARVVAGFFGGVMSGISFAIVTDVFQFKVRSTVMSYIQMAFSASQILGIPIGLFIAQKWSWNIPFLIIGIFGILNAIAVWKWVKPVTGHLGKIKDQSMFGNIFAVLKTPRYLFAFLTTFFLATGGFMLMPFSSPFLVYNVGIDEAHLSYIFLYAGIGTFIFTPIFGRLSDKYGKFKIFAIGSFFAAILIHFYTALDTEPLFIVASLYTVLMIAVSSRMSAAPALISAIPAPEQRGAFMNINSSIQQISGGIATLIAGKILIQNSNGSLQNFTTIGYLTMFTLSACVLMMYGVNKMVNEKG